MSQKDTAADLFGTAASTAVRSRYTLDANPTPTRAGGVVGCAVDGKGQPLLVHTAIPSRNEQAIDLGAVATAVVAGAIPLPILVRAFAQEGKLEDLKKAVAAHK